MINCRGTFGMGKRGHVPTVLLLPLALALAIMVFVSFVLFSGEVETEAGKIAILSGELEFKTRFVKAVLDDMVEEAVEEANGEVNCGAIFKENFEEIASRRRAPGFGNFYSKIVVDKDYDVIPAGDKCVLSIKNVFVEFELDKSKVRREFGELKVSFDKDGLV